VADSCDTRIRRVYGSPAERVEVFSRVAQAAVEAPEVELAARACRRSSPEETARACLKLVQGLPYRPDRPGEADDLADPCHALVIGGDCEDLAVLLVALWASAGLAGRVVWLVQGGASQDHVSAEVWLPGRHGRAAGWAYGEPTVRGARLGEAPHAAARRLGVGREAPGVL
jgi:transglutaminase-like putative cysteine protease